MINNNNNKDDEVAELHEILEARKRAEERLAKIRQLQKRPSVANQGAQEQIAKEFEARRRQDGMGTLIWGKIQADPIVPAGALCTAAVLMGGFRAFLRADQRLSQKMMRGRVLAQALTVAAIGFGTLYLKATEEEEEDTNNTSNTTK